MSEVTAYQRQDLFETELASSLTAAATTITLATAPSFTLSSGSFFATIDPTGTPEIVEVTAMVGTTLTVTRGIALYEGAGSSAAVHAGGVKFIISNNWKTFDKIREAIATKLNLTGGTLTGSLAFSGTSTSFRLPNLTTAQRLALTPALGMEVYDTDLGQHMVYLAGVWTSTGATTVSIAADHTGGKVDIASASEIAAATAVDATSGAINVIPVSQTIKGATDATAENKLPVLDSAGDLDFTTIPTGTSQVQSKATLTAKGDLYVATASGVVARQGVGTNGQYLVADSTQTNGLKWATRPGIATGLTTRAGATGTGTQSIAHGLGIAPRLVRITATGRASNNDTAAMYSFGTGVSTSTYQCAYGAAADGGLAGTAAGSSSSFVLWLVNGDGADMFKATISTLDATNITLNFSVNDANAGTANIIWEAYE